MTCIILLHWGIADATPINRSPSDYRAEHNTNLNCYSMNLKQLKALIRHCEITFGTMNVSLSKVIRSAMNQAELMDMNLADYLDYLVDGNQVQSQLEHDN